MKTKFFTILYFIFSSLVCSAQWSQLVVPNSTVAMRTVYFKNANEGYAAGAERIRRTVDGGVTWDTVGFGIYDVYLAGTIVEKIEFVNANEGIAAGWSFFDNAEIIFKTFDGGVTWDSIMHTGAFGSYLTDMFFVNSTTGYCSGKNGVIMKTTNGGNNWSYLTSGVSANLNGIFFTSATIGYAVGDSVILKTTNGGASWSNQFIPGMVFNDLYFKDANNGFAVATNGIYKTTNGGAAWNLFSSTLSGNEITGINADTLFIASDYQSILKSNDGGATWLPQFTAPLNKVYFGIFFLNTTTGFAVTFDGKVFKTTTCGDAVPQNDAGVVNIESPPAGSCQGTYPLYVEIKNFGQQALTSATINWTVNGALQAPYNWNGNLAFDSTSASISPGNVTYGNGNTTIEAYTTSENGNADYVHYNDSTKQVFGFGTLNGNYTVGGAGPDYATILDAVTDLNANGVCGNVNFEIRNENYTNIIFTISNFTRTHANDVVTFEAESGDSSQVVLSRNGFIASLNASKGITFKKLTFTSTATAAIELHDSTNNFTLTHCVLNFSGPLNESIYHDGQGCDSVTIVHNAFNDVSGTSGAGVGLGVSSATYTNTNINISDNIFTTQLAGSISVNYASNLTINHNKIISTITAAMYIQHISGSMIISNNYSTSQNGAISLTLKNCNGISGSELKVVNNFISFDGSIVPLFSKFLYVKDCHYIDFYYNTFNANQENGIYLEYTDTVNAPNLRFNNNIISNLKTPPAYIFYILNANADYTWYGKIFRSINHNAYCNQTENSHFAFMSNYNYVIDFNEWKSAFPLDNNSVFANAQLSSYADYHIYPNTSNVLLDGHGQAIAGITTDIEGNTRNATAPDIGCYEFSIFANDAAVKSFTQNANICSGINDVLLKIANSGSAALTSATINWSINNVNQLPYSWTGNLVTADSSSSIIIGTNNFISGNTYNIKAWTTNPNGIADANHLNDTLAVTFSAKGLSGIKTIGGTAPDYATFAAAINDLNVNGVCGPVIFKVRAGVYVDDDTIHNIAGGSAINTVTFEAENGNNTSVTLYSPVANSHFFTLDSASYITIHLMTFGNNSLNIYAVYMAHQCHHITVADCRMYYANIAQIDSKPVHDITISNNYIEVAGINLVASGIINPALSRNIVVENNQVKWGIISVGAANNVMINNNSIDSVAGGSSGVLIAAYGEGKVIVTNNYVHVTSGDGIEVSNCIGHYNDSSLVANNMSVIDTNPYSCFDMGGSTCMRVIHNSGALLNTINTLTYALNGPLTGTVYNNCIYNNGNGSAMFLNNSANFHSDYNNIYGATEAVSTNGFIYPTLSAWQTATGKDLHSVSVLPQYISGTDLHINANSFLDGAGIFINDITTDYDGNLRNNPPDIGADEFYVQDSLVWPGDCNFDGIANNYDLLSIGLYFNQSGIARNIVTNVWAGQPSTDWGSMQYCGVDKKHADCNGDGIVSWSDTTAIKQNWGLQHPFRLAQQLYNSLLADLYFYTSSTTYHPGDTVDVQIWLGTSGVPVDSVYGISFDIGLDSAVVKPGSAIYLFPPGLFGIENVSTITTYNIVGSAASAAISRITGTDTSGYGITGVLHFIIDPNISTSQTLNLNFINYQAITANGTFVNFNTGSSSLNIVVSTGVSEINSENDILLSPNPVSDQLDISIAEPFEGMTFEIQITDITGRVVLQKYVQPTNNHIHLDTSQLAQGNYSVKIVCDKNVRMKKFVKE